MTAFVAQAAEREHGREARLIGAGPARDGVGARARRGREWGGVRRRRGESREDGGGVLVPQQTEELDDGGIGRSVDLREELEDRSQPVLSDARARVARGRVGGRRPVEHGQQAPQDLDEHASHGGGARVREQAARDEPFEVRQAAEELFDVERAPARLEDHLLVRRRLDDAPQGLGGGDEVAAPLVEAGQREPGRRVVVALERASIRLEGALVVARSLLDGGDARERLPVGGAEPGRLLGVGEGHGLVVPLELDVGDLNVRLARARGDAPRELVERAHRLLGLSRRAQEPDEGELHLGVGLGPRAGRRVSLEERPQGRDGARLIAQPLLRLGEEERGLAVARLEAHALDEGADALVEPRAARAREQREDARARLTSLGGLRVTRGELERRLPLPHGRVGLPLPLEDLREQAVRPALALARGRACRPAPRRTPRRADRARAAPRRGAAGPRRRARARADRARS